MSNNQQKFGIDGLINIWLYVGVIIDMRKVDYKIGKVEKL